jgi:cytochrome c
LTLRLAALLLVAAAPAAAQDGAALFEARCASCHAVAAAAPPMAGPNLFGLVGRVIGGDRTFGYSPVLEAAGRTGQRWTAALLARFLADPEEMFPGLWMGGNGLRIEAERAAVVAFLASAD